ncbi:MAG TPA: hypothetical protein VNZ58_10015 [Thermomicrobiales bacterium]|nr:hypothetical protein [Thermomicrobiales bacterium]
MAQTTFDPSQHLSSIKGQEYLEVKWRLAWLRAEHPDAVITTQLASHEDDRAIFSAHVQIPDGGSATGWGSETAGSFGNYIEKAETKAIGRALAALGFGTQFCMDFDDGPETGVLADAPVQLRRSSQNQNRQEPAARESRGQYDAMTEPQKRKISAMSHNVGLPASEINEVAISVTGAPFGSLTKQQASALIDHLTRLESDMPGRKAS